MSIQKFKQYKEILEAKKTELAELTAELKLLKENAIEQFGTDDVKKLTKIIETHKKTLIETEDNIEQLDEEIEDIISELEDE